MTTFPRAHLETRNARLATRFLAIAVVAPVFAFPGTGWAGLNARVCTFMETNQQTTTLGPASFVNSSHSTLAACSGTLVTTFQISRAADWAIVWGGKADDSHIVTTWPLSSLHQRLAFLRARFSTALLTPMATPWKHFLALCLTLNSVQVTAASHCVGVSTQW